MAEPANALSQQDRDKLVATLNSRLADGIDLMLRSKLAHWHVESPDYYALNSLLDRVVADVAEHVDILAERAVQLGGRAKGAVAHVARSSHLTPCSEDDLAGAAHLASLSDTIEEFAGLIRESERLAAELGDRDTSEIFSGVSRDLDTHLAFLHGHMGGSEKAGA